MVYTEISIPHLELFVPVTLVTRMTCMIAPPSLALLLKNHFSGPKSGKWDLRKHLVHSLYFIQEEKEP